MSTSVPEAGTPLQVVIFSLEGKNLAVDILKVQEIIRMVEITPVPKMPPFALGVINLRGKVVPIINIREKLGMPAARPTVKTCIVLIRSGGQLIGFLVDDVAEVLSMPREAIENVEQGPDWVNSELFSGVGKLPDRLLVVLETDRLLSKQEEKALHRARPEPAPFGV